MHWFAARKAQADDAGLNWASRSGPHAGADGAPNALPPSGWGVLCAPSILCAGVAQPGASHLVLPIVDRVTAHR